MTGILGDLKELAAEAPTEFYPGSKRPLVRHPNRHEHQPLDPDRWDAKPRKIRFRGEEREFFTVGQLALALGRRPVTIRTWERNKVIPNATFQIPGKDGDPRGLRRLYSREQVEGLVKIAEEEGLLRGDYRAIQETDFTRRAFELFRSLAE